MTITIQELPAWLKNVQRKYKKSANTISRAAANRGNEVIVRNTPVWSGEHRAGWYTTLDAPSDKTVRFKHRVINSARNAETAIADSVISQGKSVINRYRVNRNKSINIVNNGRVIERINNGTFSTSSSLFLEKAAQSSVIEVRKFNNRVLQGRIVRR